MKLRHLVLIGRILDPPAKLFGFQVFVNLGPRLGLVIRRAS